MIDYEEWRALYQSDEEAARAAWAECQRLRQIIDSRPAINAGLPQTYIEWSRGVYECDAAHILGHDG